jgi:hypothetical protein
MILTLQDYKADAAPVIALQRFFWRLRPIGFFRTAWPERSLHQHTVEPTAVLKADILQNADMAESEGAVHSDRRRLPG